MDSRWRIVAAALGAAAVTAGCVGLVSGARGASAALVTLQVVPRGPGVVEASPSSADGEHLCDANSGQDDCSWKYERGTKVTLLARTDRSFAGWSDPACGDDRSCTVTVDDDPTSIAAVFGPLQLGVILSSSDTGAKITTDPAGSACPDPPGNADFCAAFPLHTSVKVTVNDTAAKRFQRWNPGCEPTTAKTCTVRIEDEPTWVGATLEGDDAPQLPTTVKVQFRVRKEGNGSGRVTASKLDCGSDCDVELDFGTPITLTAHTDPGSTFEGWNGVCERTEPSCSFAVGPVTRIRPVFARDTAAPSAPGGPAVAATTRTSISISWTASNDNVAVDGYRVYLNGVAAGTPAATSYTVDGLSCGRKYTVAVDAADAVGNRSPQARLDASTAPCALAARLAGVGVKVTKRARTVVVKVRTNRATTARLALERGRARAGGRYRLVPGTNVLRLGVPRRWSAGPARLRVTLVDPDGGALVMPARRILLPRPR